MSDAPARDWKALPVHPERVLQCAGHLLQSMGPGAVPTVREWVKLGDRDGITHMGIGAPYRAILAALETPGAKPEPIPRQPSWSDALDRIDEMKPKRGDRMKDGIPVAQADGDGGRAALKELGLDQLPAAVMPVGAVLIVIQLLWASHGEVDVAAAKAREAADRGNEPERYRLIAALLDRAAAMPTITGGSLRQ